MGGVENYNAFASKLVRRLLLPYYLAELLWYPIWFIICHETGFLLGHMWRWHEIEPVKAFTVIFISNGADTNLILGQLWFLPVLFFTEIIFIKLYNQLNNLGAEIFVAAIFLMAYISFNLKDFVWLLIGIDIALVSQIFMLAGVWIRRYNVIERITPKDCGVLTLIVIITFCLNDFVDMHSRRYGNELLFYSGGIAGTLLVMKFSALMTDGKIFSLISDCGRQSMMILVLHPIVANIAYEIIVSALKFPSEEIFTNPAIIISVTTVGVLIPLFVAKKFGKFPVLKYFCA